MLDGSGAGKSASYSKPNAYQKLGSYVFTDPKGELYDDTAGYLQRNGYKIKVLNLVNPKNSDGYNPLAHIKSDLDVDVIASTIVKGQKTGGSSADPFWDDTAEMLLKSLIYYLLATRPPEEQNLASCAEMVRAAAADSNGGNLLKEMMSVLPIEHPARTYYKNVEVASEKTFSSILVSVQAKLGKFDSKDIAEVTSTDTISFDQIGNEKTSVYVISSDTHTAYDFLLTIFFAQMIQQLYDLADNNGGKLKVPTFFILDEFANIGQIPDFDKKISTSRSRKISFSVILQNLDQLEALYDKSYETIMGNCDTHLFLGSNSTKTVEYFSKALGEKTISRGSTQVSRDKQKHKTGYSDSDQIMGRALMTPDELRRMSMDYCIIYEKGLKPVKAKKFFYFKTNMIKEFDKFKLDHNNFDAGVRGEWRKFNPYNPDQGTEKEQKDLKVESLDDLFDDDAFGTSDNQDSLNNIEAQESPLTNSVPLGNINSAKNDTTKEFSNDLDELFGDDNYTNTDEVKRDEILDIQKELEAKFDELFGDSSDE